MWVILLRTEEAYTIPKQATQVLLDILSFWQAHWKENFGHRGNAINSDGILNEGPVGKVHRSCVFKRLEK